MKNNIFFICILLIITLSNNALHRGIYAYAPKKPLPNSLKTKLKNIIVNRPHELAIDERLFVLEPRTGEGRRFDRAEHINLSLIDDILNKFIQSLSKQPLAIPETQQSPLEIKTDFIKKVFPDFTLNYSDFLTIKSNPGYQLFEPIRFLQECNCIERWQYNFRHEVETQALQHIKNTVQNKKQKIVLTEFASGDFLQLLILGTKLVNEGYKNLRINCLDTKYHSIFEQYKVMDNTLHLKSEYPWHYKEWLTFQRKTLELLRTKKEEEESSEFDIFQEDQPDLSEYFTTFFERYVTHQSLVQFVQWFNNIAPGVEIILYEDAQDYIDDCKENQELKSDIIVAIDYFPKENYFWWNLLREETLKPHGLAWSVYENVVPLNEDLTINIVETRPSDAKNIIENITKKKHYLSLGTLQSVLHFEFFIESGIKTIIKPRAINFEPYKLKPVDVIPAHSGLNEDGERITIEPIPSIKNYPDIPIEEPRLKKAKIE